MPTDCKLRVSGKNDDGDSGSEIGNTMYLASGPLGGGSLCAASNPVYDYSCVTGAAIGGSISSHIYVASSILHVP